MTGPRRRFSDLAAVHVVTESTLQWLREVAPERDFDARHHRPNVVLADIDPGLVKNDGPGREMALGDGVRLTSTFRALLRHDDDGAGGPPPEDRKTLRTVAK